MTEYKKSRPVSADGDPEPIPGSLLGAFEPVFLVSATSILRFAAPSDEKLEDFLSHCVARSPGDLISHVRRIYLRMAAGDAELLYGALLDLFLALGKSGWGLRRRLLEGAKSALKSDDFDRLQGALAGEINPVGFPYARGSVLCRGVSGTLNLIQASAVKREVYRDPLVEAREFIEYSQIDEARRLLERAVLAEPGREELQTELLALYASTRDARYFFEMLQKLEDVFDPVPSEWQQLATSLRKQG